MSKTRFWIEQPNLSQLLPVFRNSLICSYCINLYEWFDWK